jgi:hypothetical protein
MQPRRNWIDQIRPIIREHGWLVVVLYFLVHFWSRLVSPFGFGVLFTRRIHVESRAGLLDLVHLVWAVMSVTAFFLLYSSPSLYALILSLSGFRTLDLFVDFFRVAVFGNNYGRPWAGAMKPLRLQRTSILYVLLFVELVFWNACLIFVISKIDPCLYEHAVEFPHQALHVSMSTATTIGYGTYAPVKTLAILAALFEALSALLLVSGLIGGVFSLISSLREDQAGAPVTAVLNRQSGNALPIPWDYGRLWRVRQWSPIVIPFLFLAVVFAIVLRYLPYDHLHDLPVHSSDKLDD